MKKKNLVKFLTGLLAVSVLSSTGVIFAHSQNTLEAGENEAFVRNALKDTDSSAYNTPINISKKEDTKIQYFSDIT